MNALFGRKVARLPREGTLLVATDLQGNFRDWKRLEAIYEAEEAAGHAPLLVLCGDLIHGPSEDLLEEGAWPDHLGTRYADESRALILDYARFAREARTVALLGNHEHAHIGGPVVSKFHSDEAAVLEAALGDARQAVHAFLRTFPLVAVAPAGVVLTHAAPRGTEPDLESFERLRYEGYEHCTIDTMYTKDTVGALLWARGASADRARSLLAATALDDTPNAFVAYGHDVVPEGYEKVGDEQICVSTSFGLFDQEKVYLRLDLGHRYRSVHDLREGLEIVPLWS